MAQTELYSTDQGSYANGTVGGKKGKSSAAGRAGSGGARNRMKESVEDARMMKSGQREDSSTGYKITQQPSNISKKKGVMRPYQVEGLNWIMQLHDRGVSGILADEMGLGKTLQSISVVAYLREARGIKGKHIVIVPKSVLDNWMREFRVWCPVVRTLRFHGNKAERKRLRAERLDRGDFDVVITTYEMLIREKSGFLKHQWHYVIIDEAHRIKNDKSVLSQTVRMSSSLLCARRRRARIACAWRRTLSLPHPPHSYDRNAMRKTYGLPEDVNRGGVETCPFVGVIQIDDTNLGEPSIACSLSLSPTPRPPPHAHTTCHPRLVNARTRTTHLISPPSSFSLSPLL